MLNCRSAVSRAEMLVKKFVGSDWQKPKSWWKPMKVPMAGENQKADENLWRGSDGWWKPESWWKPLKVPSAGENQKAE